MIAEFRLAGTGGQGQVLAGIILADAAISYDGLYATQSQSYGPESRGGASRAEVVISDEPIDYPKVTEANLLLCMSQQAYQKYRKDVAPDGIILVDESLVKVDNKGEDPRVVAEPITQTAIDEMGRAVVANIIALGLIVGLTSVITEEAAKQAITRRVPRGTGELNLRAFSRGLEMAKRHR